MIRDNGQYALDQSAILLMNHNTGTRASEHYEREKGWGVEFNPEWPNGRFG
jgi:hypothetical protein